jgi:hypothetical protein
LIIASALLGWTAAVEAAKNGMIYIIADYSISSIFQFQLIASLLFYRSKCKVIILFDKGNDSVPTIATTVKTLLLVSLISNYKFFSHEWSDI